MTRGKRLKFALKSRGVEKQLALAVELEVHQSAITRWKDDGPISLESACRLCVALDISMDWLMLGRGSLEQHKLGLTNGAESGIAVERFRCAFRGLPPSIATKLLELAQAIGEQSPDLR